jgi:hypothetical protein
VQPARHVARNMAGFFVVAVNDLNRQDAKDRQEVQMERIRGCLGIERHELQSIAQMIFNLSILSLVILGGLGVLAVNL